MPHLLIVSPGGEQRASSLTSSSKTNNPTHEGLPSWSNHSPRPHFQTPSHWGLNSNIWFGRKTNIQDIIQPASSSFHSWWRTVFLFMVFQINLETITGFENNHFVIPDETTNSGINHQFIKTLSKRLIEIFVQSNEVCHQLCPCDNSPTKHLGKS